MNRKNDWGHIILKHLFKEYSIYDVHLKENFLTNKLKIAPKDGNRGRKLYRTLKELGDEKLIIVRISDHRNENISVNPDPNDNTSITTDNYWFHLRLTFEGLEYVTSYLRLKNQERITVISLFILGFNALFVLASVYFASQSITSKEWQKTDLLMQRQVKEIEDMRKIQSPINLSHPPIYPATSLKKVH